MSDNREILQFYKDLIVSDDDELIINVGEFEFKLFDIDIMGIYKPTFKFKSYSPNNDISFSVKCLKTHIEYELEKHLRLLSPDLQYFDIELYDGNDVIEYDYHISETFTNEILKGIQHRTSVDYTYRAYTEDTVKSYPIEEGDTIGLIIEQEPIKVKIDSNGNEDLNVEVFLKVKKATMKVRKRNTNNVKTLDVTNIIVPFFNDIIFTTDLDYTENNFNEIYDYFKPPYFGNPLNVGDTCCFINIYTTLVE